MALLRERGRPALWVLLLLLTACQRTVFEHPPAAADCDPALTGLWLSHGEPPEADGELELRIGADCRLETLSHERNGERRSEPTHLSTAQIGKRRLLWVDAGWANRSFDIEPGPLDRPGDVYVFAYRLRDGELRLFAADDRALAHAIIDDRVDGDLLQRGDDLVVRVRGKSEDIAKLVGKQRLWQRDTQLNFVRSLRDEPVEKP